MMPIAAMRMRLARSATAYRDAVLADSPTAYFRLDELSGNFFNSVDLSESASVASGSATRGVASLTLDAADKAVTLASTGRLAVPTTKYKYSSNFTFEALIKIATGALTSGATLGVVSKSAGAQYLRVSQSSAVGKGRLHWIRSNTTDLGQGLTLLSENTAYHVGVTVGVTGVTTFYLNGVSDGPGVTSTDFTGIYDILNIGSDYAMAAPREYFTGTLDEVAIYSTALTSARMLAHAQAAGLA